ncbi:hypothetical protein GPECTOR_70g529 [Gonium pectorale]|uniref:Uncharacterized protein n=1 Tax=Gonium pectorale TaxID=33097 RepID=A0A150G382_GONPE|nr:hypothetical protein GPECTOR_70g529 [Gonium pectorale]|eukprot:KXZ44298.1 hypothetical protein GPECTOR_70g529 [Gonium pectorale]
MARRAERLVDDHVQERAERETWPRDLLWDTFNKTDPHGEAVSAILNGFGPHVKKLVFASLKQIDTGYVPMPKEDRVGQYVGDHRMEFKLGPKDFNFAAGRANMEVERWVRRTAYGSEEDWKELKVPDYNAAFDKKFPEAGRFRKTVGKQAVCAQLFAATVLQSFYLYLTFVRWSEYGECCLQHSKYGICQLRGTAGGRAAGPARARLLNADPDRMAAHLAYSSRGGMTASRNRLRAGGGDGVSEPAEPLLQAAWQLLKEREGVMSAGKLQKELQAKIGTGESGVNVGVCRFQELMRFSTRFFVAHPKRGFEAIVPSGTPVEGDGYDDDVGYDDDGYAVLDGYDDDDGEGDDAYAELLLEPSPKRPRTEAGA